MAWIKRNIPEDACVQISDVTETESVIGVMGPKARDLMVSVTGMYWSNVVVPFSGIKNTVVAGAQIRATRISFVGELGYELSISVDQVQRVYDALRKAGANFNLKPLGHLALDGCRLEKGFRHWGHDLGPDISPLEGGIGFTVSKNRTNYIGANAIEKQRSDGLTQRLVLLSVADGAHGSPILLHDEPVYVGDNIVGLTTSGGRGPRTALSLCFAMVACEPDATPDQVRKRPYKIDVAGVLFAATALAKPPYDEDGKRMRS